MAGFSEPVALICIWGQRHAGRRDATPNNVGTGLLAQIDEMGQLIQIGERRQAGHLICAVRVPQPEITLYRRWGNWFAIACGLLVCVALVLGRFMNRPNR